MEKHCLNFSLAALRELFAPVLLRCLAASHCMMAWPEHLYVGQGLENENLEQHDCLYRRRLGDTVVVVFTKALVLCLNEI